MPLLFLNKEKRQDNKDNHGAASHGRAEGQVDGRLGSTKIALFVSSQMEVVDWRESASRFDACGAAMGKKWEQTRRHSISNTIQLTVVTCANLRENDYGHKRITKHVS